MTRIAGEGPERAAAFKLFGNLTLLGIMGVLGDVNRLAHALGSPTAEAFSVFKHFNPGQTLPVRAAKVEAGLRTRRRRSRSRWRARTCG